MKKYIILFKIFKNIFELNYQIIPYFLFSWIVNFPWIAVRKGERMWKQRILSFKWNPTPRTLLFQKRHDTTKCRASISLSLSLSLSLYYIFGEKLLLAPTFSGDSYFSLYILSLPLLVPTVTSEMEKADVANGRSI